MAWRKTLRCSGPGEDFVFHQSYPVETVIRTAREHHGLPDVPHWTLTDGGRPMADYRFAEPGSDVIAILSADHQEMVELIGQIETTSDAGTRRIWPIQ